MELVLENIIWTSGHKCKAFAETSASTLPEPLILKGIWDKAFTTLRRL